MNFLILRRLYLIGFVAWWEVNQGQAKYTESLTREHAPEAESQQEVKASVILSLYFLMDKDKYLNATIVAQI